MTATIVYKSARTNIHSVLSLRSSGTKLQLAARGEKTPLITGSFSEVDWVKPMLKHVAQGGVSEVKWQTGKFTGRYFLTLDQMSKIPRLVLSDSTGDVIVGGGSPDEDNDSDGGEVSAMMDPVTAGVAIVGMLIVGGLGWKAIDSGASLSASVGPEGATLEINTHETGDGPEELPDNGNDAGNRPPLLE